MSTYGQAGVTYGQPGGTYGSWGAVEVAETPQRPSGARARRRPPRILPVSQRLRWDVEVTGSGRLDRSGTLVAEIVAIPTAITASHTLDIDFAGSGGLRATPSLDVEMASRSALAARGMYLIEPQAELVRITDPPELWEMLDLLELA